MDDPFDRARTALGWDASTEPTHMPSILLKPPPSASEVTRSATNAELLSLRRELEQRQDAYAAQPDTVILLAEIATRTQAWTEAVALWARAARDAPDLRDAALYRLAVAYRNIGSYGRARQALAAIDPSFPDPAAIADERRNIRAGETGTAIRTLGNRLVDELVKSARGDHVDHLLKALLLLRNDPAHVVEAITTVARYARRPRIGARLPRSLPGRRPFKPRRFHPTARTVFLAGFGWSGTGALHDYLTQAQNTSAPFGKFELWAFERNWSARKVLRAATSDGAQVREAVLRFVFQSALGIGAPLETNPASVGRNSLLHFCKKDSARVEAVAQACIELLQQTQISSKQNDPVAVVHHALERFFGRMVNTVAGSSDAIIVSNGITAANIDLVRLVPEATALAIFRDARDQFAAQYFEFANRGQLSVDSFIKKVRDRTSRYETALQQSRVADRVVAVQFEEFVLSAEYRLSLTRRLGLSVGSPTSAAAYKPEQSERNIGIYKDYPNQAHMRQIENELPSLIYRPS
jgi:hypothetical protein